MGRAGCSPRQNRPVNRTFEQRPDGAWCGRRRAALSLRNAFVASGCVKAPFDQRKSGAEDLIDAGACRRALTPAAARAARSLSVRVLPYVLCRDARRLRSRARPAPLVDEGFRLAWSRQQAPAFAARILPTAVIDVPGLRIDHFAMRGLCVTRVLLSERRGVRQRDDLVFTGFIDVRVVAG